mmetsp:Transcript_27321/g.48345  ORF Transcript_27321/g.48345 Transcript_27321/m.48345 type:complete len:524 (+) Transcript_27321:363-1934(+)
MAIPSSSDSSVPSSPIHTSTTAAMTNGMNYIRATISPASTSGNRSTAPTSLAPNRTTAPPSRSATPGTTDEPLALGDVDTDAVDEMLSKQLANLSFTDRNAISEEVHGVRNLAAVETPQIVEKSLWLMNTEIERIEHKPAYHQAVYVLHSRWVHDRDFRLRCLRAERFDVVKAAKRFLKFLDLLLEYFGTDALMRPIRMSDLGKEEMEILRSGQYQLLPFRDRSGRRVIACVGEVGLAFSLFPRMKFLIYLWWVAAEDVETQQRGVISIFWPSFEAAHKFPDKREATEAERVFGAIPTRMTALHQCTPDTPAYKLMQAVVILTLSVESRTRMKFHTATDVEIGYGLMGYGIPVDLIPMTGTGNVKTKNLQQWIKTRKVIEDTQEDSPIECPFMNDVVFRFGKSYLSHPGNTAFRGLIEANFDEHNDASTTDAKVAVTWRIVQEVERRGGRFLVWHKRGWWEQITDRAQIRSKVAVSLKEHKKRVLAKKNMQSMSSGTFKFERQDGKKRKRADDGTEPGKCLCA